jgi:hypothetical protein
MPCIEAAVAASRDREGLSYRFVVEADVRCFWRVEPSCREEKPKSKASEADLLPHPSSTSNRPTTIP